VERDNFFFFFLILLVKAQAFVNLKHLQQYNFSVYLFYLQPSTECPKFAVERQSFDFQQYYLYVTNWLLTYLFFSLMDIAGQADRA